MQTEKLPALAEEGDEPEAKLADVEPRRVAEPNYERLGFDNPEWHN